MALFEYQKQTQRLIRDVRQLDINPADLIVYINQARAQLAGESQSIKILGTISLVTSSMGPYYFSSIALPGASGVSGVLNVRMLRYIATGGQIWVTSRPWPWFQQYNMFNQGSGPPSAWAQYAEGVNGTFFISPFPDKSYVLNVDAICYPDNLVNDTTVEAIPFEWTVAIPYYAAYLALLTSQTSDGLERADKMYNLYQGYLQRGRQIATPDVLSRNYPQQPPPMRGNNSGA